MAICALCRRTLLVGERYRHWEAGNAASGIRLVCALCETEALRAGWVRATQPPLRQGAGDRRWGARLVVVGQFDL